ASFDASPATASGGAPPCGELLQANRHAIQILITAATQPELGEPVNGDDWSAQPPRACRTCTTADVATSGRTPARFVSVAAPCQRRVTRGTHSAWHPHMQQLNDRDLPDVIGGISFTGNLIALPGVTAKEASGTFMRWVMRRDVLG